MGTLRRANAGAGRVLRVLIRALWTLGAVCNPHGALASSVTGTESQQWVTGGHDAGQTYYSPLKQVNTSNVSRLGFAWSYELNTTQGQEATPVVIDGVLYASAPWGVVHAVDARSGRKLWSFDPHVKEAVTQKVCCGIVSRGLAVAQGRVFAAAIDGRLFALDAKDGHPLWSMDTIVDHERGYSVTGAPYVASNIVVIGNSGAELDARGYVSAYDTRTGKLAWRFFIVPGNHDGPFENPELAKAARTWSPRSRWEVGLGGTAWDGMAYDPQLDLVYVGAGNSALYPRQVRSPGGGDNLFVASILALHRRTGRLAWYYQTTPGDQWDYTATQKMILTDLEVNGKRRSVLVQAPKNGFFYVLDRKTGELLSAKPYASVNWASQVDLKSGRPLETGQADYESGPKLIFPGPTGAHNWQPMAYNPDTRLVYIPVIEAGAVFFMPPEPFKYAKGGINMDALFLFPAQKAGDWGMESALAKTLPPLSELSRGQPDTTVRGFLRAWDPVQQQVAWEVETSEQWVGELNSMWNGGGVMTTGGNLVFQGRSTGYLHVYNAKTGAALVKLNLGVSIMAAPMTYELNGVQYIAVMAGFGGALGGSYPTGTAAYRFGNSGRIVALKLDGGPVPLPAEVTHTEGFPHPAAKRFGTAAQVSHGLDLIKRYCSHCHSNEASGTVPDLRRISAATFKQFDDIVLRGARAAKGMGNFSSLVSAADTADIRAALMSEAWDAYDASQKSGGPTSAPHTPQAVPPQSSHATSSGAPAH